MATQFEYTAKNKNGETVKGEIEAEDKSSIASQLRSQGYFVTEIKEKRAARDVKEVFNIRKKVKLKDLAIFSQQFAAMIDAGISLVDALFILAKQTEHSTLKDVITKVQEDVETGISLADAFAKHPKVFP